MTFLVIYILTMFLIPVVILLLSGPVGEEIAERFSKKKKK
tara:strand:- start:6114 stop:6233 length:120 start_codon:yes stop_codon:yes gene_type:complete